MVTSDSQIMRHIMCAILYNVSVVFVILCVIVIPSPMQLCSELATKLNETASQPLQETATKKRTVFKKVTNSNAVTTILTVVV